MTKFRIKSGDTKPYIQAVLTDSDGTVIDLTGATAKFNLGDSTFASYFTGTATITDESAGELEYRWDGTTDNNTPGTYYGEFEITYSDSKIQTFPADNTLIVEVYQDFN